MMRFFFRRRPRVEDNDTPFNEFRDPYLEEIVDRLRIDLEKHSDKLEDENKLQKESK